MTKSSEQIAKEVAELDKAEETTQQLNEEGDKEDQGQEPVVLFETALIFHTDIASTRVELGKLDRNQVMKVTSDVSNAFNVLRQNSAFLMQDVDGNINFFNLYRVSRIEFSQKVVTK